MYRFRRWEHQVDLISRSYRWSLPACQKSTTCDRSRAVRQELISRTCQRSLDARQSFNFGEMSPSLAFRQELISRTCQRSLAARNNIHFEEMSRSLATRQKKHNFRQGKDLTQPKMTAGTTLQISTLLTSWPRSLNDAVERTVSVNG